MNLSFFLLWPYTLFSISCSLLCPLLFSKARIFFFIPNLIVMFYQKTLTSCLWASFAFGLFLDLISDSFFGLNTLTLCLMTTIIYPQKKLFFPDNPSTLPILTFLASDLIFLQQAAFVYVFEKNISISSIGLFSNLFIMPFFDMVYAFCLFLLPQLLLQKKRRRGNDYFLMR